MEQQLCRCSRVSVPDYPISTSSTFTFGEFGHDGNPNAQVLLGVHGCAETGLSEGIVRCSQCRARRDYPGDSIRIVEGGGLVEWD